jgi:hypothetical protein
MVRAGHIACGGPPVLLRGELSLNRVKGGLSMELYETECLIQGMTRINHQVERATENKIP